jgi:hypothetical protein
VADQPTSAVTTEVVEPNADDVFAAAFAQLSEADAKANGPMPKPEPNPNAQAQRTEDDRATSEAQRDAKAFAKPDQTGPTGPDAAAIAAGTTGATGGATGATGSGVGDLPADDKEKAAAEALAAAEAARVAQGTTGPTGTTGGQVMGDDELVKRLANLIKTVEPVDERTTQRQPVDPLAMFSAEEKKFLVDYEKEYPDIARAEFMRRRVENQQLVTWMFTQINAALAPKFEQIEALATRTHAGDLQQQVPTYNNEVRDKVIAWAGEQPAYKKVAYQYVIQQGTVDEVADMIADWSKATGYTPPAKTGPTGTPGIAGVDPAKAAADAAKLASDAAKAAAAAKLAPVKSGNAQRAVTAIAPTDYDGAFDWATKLLEKA